eukprot:TRINITY_DN55785_c0_g1_i1.p1 TRINITY_DN55785_c0_g1~~TRINITY_DN55785_c0_g1_i1.p1  ORF type:complete len:89 (-),score=13.86 TRINITY_DN55785_c0_g1_i1:84-314(-)
MGKKKGKRNNNNNNKKKKKEPEIEDNLKTQRKINHILESSGRGDNFVYHRYLNRKCGISSESEVYLTEKWVKKNTY